MAEDNFLVTGSWGEPHVTSAQQRNFYSGILGGGQFVMQGMGLTVQDANTLRLSGGFGVMNGADIEVPEAGATLAIDNGTQGQNRNDLVVMRYERDESEPQNVRESVRAVVVKGTPSNGAASDPEHNAGSILDGDNPVDMPLWRVPISGLTPGEPVRLYKELPPVSWPLPVAQGGTGATAFSDNAVVLGGAAIKQAQTASGALYATAANGAPKFGTLPVAQGGTGATSGTAALNNLGIKAWLLANVYKVGYVWVSYTGTSPASIVGGTWAAITGRFPYFNGGTGTGGANSQTITTAQMPRHNHELVSGLYNVGPGAGSTVFSATGSGSGKHTESTGSGSALNNMPAYQTLYAWRRTA